jgi:hypothetical protein
MERVFLCFVNAWREGKQNNIYAFNVVRYRVTKCCIAPKNNLGSASLC